MPILKEEPNLYPETLLDEPPADVADRHWFALYTKARQEKSLARDAQTAHPLLFAAGQEDERLTRAEASIAIPSFCRVRISLRGR